MQTCARMSFNRCCEKTIPELVPQKNGKVFGQVLNGKVLREKKVIIQRGEF